ncbi:pyrroline-5-carboxylate reductase [Azospirillum baldaniorum]|uniref:Pyrroline-5-carboxylate reductase n=1 Tax=Azospirillum baldaniorum TaxID=1064539 RepID=A0A9P1JQC7_9PROT|nr:pyrroline-5-carboxylate reductase [Azospirillum baldaniorum]AWJ90263.1 pyrroline-5-carboxylate reductase [Azospirillum baldaniorum]TWA67725.1 pyrroline-5-carboxylate reductase [Azospirillum baldaniorum]TWA77183.1 pyrroline-5-carboxylate reductase [Azospirillum brasilense]CCC97651.1 pyrroline-5-carboxylate reductase [Azospirillum baldaniorum]
MAQGKAQGCTLLLAGCGKMGGAMLDGWLKAGIASSVAVIEPSGLPESLRGNPAVVLASGVDALPAGFAPDVVVLAVKPQVMDSVLPAYRALVRPGTVFLSVAAGKTIASFEAALGEGAAIVRSMPNTPAAIGRGMTVAVGNPVVTEAQKSLCDSLLRAVGDVAWVEDESLLDPVTAVSGSGPAYVFLMVEAMAKAGEAAGLPAELAMRLARATVAGAGELLHQSPTAAADLRKAVTSPNGTTQAALDVLMAGDGMQPLFDRAVAAAANRSRELAK